MKEAVQKFGRFLSGMVMPNIGAFIAWGFITALFIASGWLPNEDLSTMVSPMLSYILPVLIAFQGGRMVGGDRGGVMGAIAVIGVICGAPDTPMLMGAMLMGPLAGLVIKKFDGFMKTRMPAGFEMLINNFSVGIFGMFLAIFGFYAIGPLMSIILAFLSKGVAILIQYGLLPLVALFIEPAKVLFLNNAINHGIFTPLGIEQVSEAGKSIMYMLETNPGPGLGVLLAYWLCSKDRVAKASAPGAIIIHFFGGIHEIYFPYVLMNPLVIIAPIVGNMAAIFFFSITGAGLSGPPSPGSIIAFLAMAPRGTTLIALSGVAISAAVSFAIAAIIVRTSSAKSLESAQEEMKEMKSKSKNMGSSTEVKKVVFACDAGMGSSALGATKFRNRIKELGTNVEVTNTSVDNVPADADVVVCQGILMERACKSAPQAEVVTIKNFLADPVLDELYERIASQKNGAKLEEKEKVSASDSKFKIDSKGVVLGLGSVSKEEAIRAAGKKMVELGYVDHSYIDAMIEREELLTTYMGLGVAIPHGTSEAKKAIKKTGVVCLQFPEGVDFGEEKAELVFGIAGIGDEHIDLLSGIANSLEDEELLEKLKTTKDKNVFLNIFG
ncbi:MAG: PTS mannitol transporter subunit IICBA [Anaerotignaceae bacterium]